MRDEFGQTHAFHHSIRDELIARGIIWQQADGLWRIKLSDVDIVERKYRDLACCDFCSGRPVVWTARCDTFEVDDHISVRDWMACDTCGQMIVAHDRVGLLRRAFAAYHLCNDESPAVRHIARDHLRKFQAGFWQHWRGIERIPARPFGH